MCLGVLVRTGSYRFWIHAVMYTSDYITSVMNYLLFWLRINEERKGKAVPVIGCGGP
jgi:hypothetical protein